jgi:hypothetical protein
VSRVLFFAIRIGVVALVSIAGFAAGSATKTRGDDVLACSGDEIAVDIVTSESRDGFGSSQEAVEDGAIVLEQDGVSDADEIVRALRSRSGESRYDPGTGILILGDRAIARLVVSELNDGTWAMERIDYCVEG